MEPLKNVENHLSSTDPKWFAVYCKYRCEKLVLKDLLSKNIKTYLPLNRVLREYATSKKWVELPLIPNYIFVKITAKEYVKVLETLHVISFLKIANNLLSIPQKEIEILKQVVGGEQIEVTVASKGLKEQDRVEIISGRLKGLRGVLKKVKGKRKIIVLLDTIGYALEMEVSLHQVKKVPYAC